MATDKSEPRTGLIIKVGILAISTLIGVRAALVPYFDHVAQAEDYTKYASIKPDALMSLRDDEHRRMTSGPMPIERAMQQLETKGRMGFSPDVMPTISRDVAPLQGWVKMPSEVPAIMMAAPDGSAPAAASGERDSRRLHKCSSSHVVEHSSPTTRQRRSPSLGPGLVKPSPLVRLLTVLTLVLCSAQTREAYGQRWATDNPEAVPNTTPAELEGVDVIEHLGDPLPRDATFRDSDGSLVKLGDYFDGKRPTLFVFAYHTCPMLCSLVLDATVKSLNEVAWTVGEQFDVVSVSIDPKDSPETATKKRAQVVDTYARGHGSTKGWHFLTGDESNIRKVTEAIGFSYRYDARQKQYAHPAAIYLLEPDGRIARYLYGIQFEPNDVRLGLLEASKGHSVTTTERILLYCYHYDPQGKHYSLVALNVMRLGGALTLVVIGSFLGVMFARERRKRLRERTTKAELSVSASHQPVTTGQKPAMRSPEPRPS